MQTDSMVQSNAQPNSSRRWQLAICFFTFILIGSNGGAIGVLLPSYMAQYDVNKAQISLISLMGTFGYLTGAFSNGFLTERLGRRVLLMTGASVYLLGAAMFFMRPPTILVFLVALFVIAFGEALLDAGSNAYIASLPNNTGFLNYLHAFYGFGALFGPVLVSLVLQSGLSWNTTYLIWVIMGLMALAGFSRFPHESPSAPSESDTGKKGNVTTAALRLSLVWFSLFFLFIDSGTELGVANWSYTFLIENRHGLELFSAWSVSGYWLGLMIGRLVMGWFSRKITKQRLVELCLIGIIIGVFLLWFVPNTLVSALGLWVIGFSIGPIFPTVISVLSELIPARLQSSAIGIVSAGGSIGATFFPLVIGNLAQFYGIWILMPYTFGLTILMLSLWLFVTRRKASEKKIA